MGLSHDMPLLHRRRLLGVAAIRKIPEETAGPYPGDGSNGPNALTRSGIVRGDIRKSFGKAKGKGVTTVKLKLITAATGKPAKGLAVCTSGTATATASPRCTAGGSPRRTTCGGSRPPTAPGG